MQIKKKSEPLHCLITTMIIIYASHKLPKIRRLVIACNYENVREKSLSTPSTSYPDKQGHAPIIWDLPLE